MHINKLDIKGFGRIKDRTVNLKNGINIIYGANEAGKTTLQWYIRGMLYGLKNTRQTRGSAPAPQKRYEPWDPGQYGGSLEYTLDDGSTYKIERNFDNGSIRLFDSNFNDITDSFGVGKDKNPLIVERQLGLDEASFERTVLIKQSEVRLDDASAGLLAGKIANASSTGMVDISFNRAEKALADALKKNVGTERTTTQPLDKLEERLEKLGEIRDRLKRQQEQRLMTGRELLDTKKSIGQLKKDKEFYSFIEELVELRKSIDANLKKEAGLREALKNLKLLDESSLSFKITRTEALQKSKPEKNRSLLKMVSVAFLAAAALLAGSLLYRTAIEAATPVLQLVIINTGLIITAITGIYLLYKSRREIVQDAPANISYNTILNDNNQSSIYNAVSLLCGKQLNDPEAVRKELSIVTMKLEQLSNDLDKGVAEAGRMDCNTAGAITKDNIEAKVYDLETDFLINMVRNESGKIKDRLIEAALKEKYLEGQLNHASEVNEELQQVEEESFALKEKIEYLKQVGQALSLAREVLQEAAAQVKRTFAPELNLKMSQVITALTGHKYNDLRGDDRLALKVAIPENGDVKSVMSLSGAAADQMYLALRLAMSGLLTAGGESLPLIMDEVFSQFDDRNTILALKYLHNTYEKKQVLIFTCKKREVELVREICGDRLNLVEL